MTTITSWKDRNKESVKYEAGKIDETRDVYLKEFGLISIEDSSLNDARKLFVRVIEDFKKAKLSIDELSSFGFEIFHGVAKKNKDSELFQASLSAADLAFAIRNEATFNNISSYLTEIFSYYDRNK